VEINLLVRAIEFILDRVMRNLCCIGGSLRQFVRAHSFRTQEHQSIEYLSNATEAKQTTRSLTLRRGVFRRTIMIEMGKIKSAGRVRRKVRTYCIICAGAILGFVFGACQIAHAQGVATGGTAVPARPLPPGMKAPVVRYEDVAARAGLTGKNVSGAERGKQYIVETTGTGVAIFDYDNDGLPDIFLVNADRLDETAPKPTHFLYHNLGGLKFEDVTQKAGLAHTGWGQGVCVGDIDNDGNPDLFITQWGQNVLYRNQGHGVFRDETKARGLIQPKPRWSTGCAFFDFNRDGYQDLVVVHYVDFDLQQTPRPGDKAQCQWKGMPVLCGPRGLPAETISLYQNDRHGNFTDVS
jgi:hypothetical protein